MLTPWKESYDQPRQHIKKQRHYFANKGPSTQGYCFSSGHVWMWEVDCKESWALENWCFWTVVLEKTLESPLDCKEIQPVYTKGDQSWVFIGRTDDKAETPILWPPDEMNWLIWKDPDAGKRLKAEGEGDYRRWDAWRLSPTQWTWVWVNSTSWWWTGRPGVLQPMGSQSRTWLSNWTELNWTKWSETVTYCSLEWVFLPGSTPVQSIHDLTRMHATSFIRLCCYHLGKRWGWKWRALGWNFSSTQWLWVRWWPIEGSVSSQVAGAETLRLRANWFSFAWM